MCLCVCLGIVLLNNIGYEKWKSVGRKRKSTFQEDFFKLKAQREDKWTLCSSFLGQSKKRLTL